MFYQLFGDFLSAVAYTALHFESKLSSKLFENSLMMDTDIFNFENSSIQKKKFLPKFKL